MRAATIGQHQVKGSEFVHTQTYTERPKKLPTCIQIFLVAASGNTYVCHQRRYLIAVQADCTGPRGTRSSQVAHYHDLLK